MQTETEIQKLIDLINDPDDDVRCATYLIDLINDLDDKVKQLEGK